MYTSHWTWRCFAVIVVAQFAQAEDWHFTGPNIALHKPAVQWKGDFGIHKAGFAVDGNISTTLETGSCTHTAEGVTKTANWTVDLQDTFFIKGVRIYNRYMNPLNRYYEQVTQRLKDFYVIGSEPGKETLYDDAKQSPPQYKELVINITIEPTRNFSKLTIQLPPNVSHPDDNGYSILTLCEVQVYAVLCDEDTFPNGRIVNDNRKLVDGKNYTSLGSVISFQCNDGFELKGSHSITCLENGTYSASIPKCKKLCDKLPDIVNGFYLRNETFYAMDTVDWTCNTFYESDASNKNLTCNINGYWDKPYPICKPKRCFYPQINKTNFDYFLFENGSIYEKDNITAGNYIRVVCQEGYNPNHHKLKCTAQKQWSPLHENVRCVRIKCNNLEVENGKFTYSNVSENSKINHDYGTIANLHCNDLFKPFPHKYSARCGRPDGSWYGGNFTCESAESEEPISQKTIEIGIGIGAGVLLIIIILVVVFFYRRRSKQKPPSEHMKPTTNSTLSNGDQKSVKFSEILGNTTAPTTSSNSLTTGPPTKTINKEGDANEYYCFTDTIVLPKRGIKLEDLADFVLDAGPKNDKYTKEFKGFPAGMTQPHGVALKNRAKNRYKNIYAYDASRVVLQVWSPTTEADYINACFIHGYDEPKKYIASQGATKENIDDVWRMIWQTNCGKIVMLTNIREEGKTKCEKYWPEEEETQAYGSIIVTAHTTEVFSNFVIRAFTVYRVDEEKRRILQFHFTAWPDRGVPRFCSSLVHFRNKVKTTHSSCTGPLIVHCSAGIGRTGTYIALDILTDQGLASGVVDVPGCVETLRRQRVDMVQTKEQYIFVHQALVETLMLSTSALSTSKFPDVYKHLKEIDPIKGERNIDIEYKMIGSMSPTTDESQYASAKDVQNRTKNRYNNILPVAEFMPSLFEPGYSENGGYINAVFLPSYKEHDALIITQTPMETTKADFWKMIFHQGVHTIIMVNHDSEMQDAEVYWPKENEKTVQGGFTIMHSKKERKNEHVILTLTLEFQSLEPRTLHLLQFGAWLGDKLLPDKPYSMLSALDIVLEWQRKTGNKPIVVHCMNGADKSGLFCVLYALLERTRIEHDVAIPQIIQEMRHRRQQIIPNVDQFEYCHDVVSEYLKQFETYSNFSEL